MSLWNQLNQMDKAKKLFMMHPDLFADAGLVFLNQHKDQSRYPEVFLGGNMTAQERRAFAEKFRQANWQRTLCYPGASHYDYEGEIEGVFLKIEGVEPVPRPQPHLGPVTFE